MTLLNDLTGKVYSADKAKEVAQQLQESECDGWKYVAELKDGHGRVLVYDETGDFLGVF